MGLKIGLNSFQFTNVPSEDQLNSEKRYYVYEWFIKDTGEVFYLGKGTGRRYLQDKNEEFLKVKNAFDVDVRIVKNHLSEHEALELEENLMIKRTNEGNVLANVQVPVIGGGVYYQERNYKYMEAPSITSSKVDMHYFHVQDSIFDTVSEDKLLKSSLKESSLSTMWDVYLQHPDVLDIQDKRQKTVDEANRLIKIYCDYVKTKGGHVYKSLTKLAKSVVVDGEPTKWTIDNLHDKGYEVYHLVDVIKYIKSKKMTIS